jgi:PAS domain S-box-containing protein
MLLFPGLPMSRNTDTDDHPTTLPEAHQGAALPADEAALLRQSLDHLGHVFWVATWPEKRLLYANQEFEKVWGISPEVATHEPDRLTAAVHPDDRAGWIAAHTNPNGSDTEYRLCRPDGRVRWLRESIFPIRDAAGRPVRLVGLAKDITAYKRLGDAVRESEERFRKFFDLNPSPSCIFSARTGKVVEINTAFEELTGYARREVLGQSLGKLNLWLDPTLPALVLHALRQKAAPQAFDTTIQTRTGQIRDVTVAANLVTIGGRPCVVAVATDLTEFNDLRRQLTESEARFRSLVENAPDILICTTLDGEVTYLNHADLGCQESILLGQNLLDYATDANAIRAAMREVMTTGQAASFEAQFHFTAEHQRWCAGRVAPIRCGENITELLFRLRDIEAAKPPNSNSRNSTPRLLKPTPNSASWTVSRRALPPCSSTICVPHWVVCTVRWNCSRPSGRRMTTHVTSSVLPATVWSGRSTCSMKCRKSIAARKPASRSAARHAMSRPCSRKSWMASARKPTAKTSP